MKMLCKYGICMVLIGMLCACGTTSDPDTPKQKNSETKKSGELIELTDQKLTSSASTKDGYYYMSQDAKILKDGRYATHLMYMDFASKREIFLCSDTGCKHDSEDCQAVFLTEEFPVASTKIFIYHDHLYILAREYDNDGSVSTFSKMDSEFNEMEAQQTMLYRVDLDGTNRKKIYTFDAELTVEEMVFGDDQGMYFIVKKCSAEKENQSTYITSSNRRLVFLDESANECEEVCSLDFQDHIYWRVIGSANRSLIMKGIDFGRELNREETTDEDTYRSFYTQADSVYARVDLDTKSLQEITRRNNQYLYSEAVVNDHLILSSTKDSNIESIDVTSGETKTIAKLSKNNILDVIDDTLCCTDWDLSKDHTYAFVNSETGKIQNSTLVNKMNGWRLEFRAVVGDEVLVINDYDAKRNSDDSYEIFQYKHALISKSDLFQGIANYHPIAMVGSGQ